MRCVRISTETNTECGENEVAAILYNTLLVHVPTGLDMEFGDAWGHNDIPEVKQKI